MNTTSTATRQARMSPRKFQAWRWLQRIGIGALVLLLAFTGLTWAAGVSAKSSLAKQNPAPGQLVDVGGYQMHLNCAGQGSPTVIMESGNNDFSVQWALIQPEVAKFTRACTYDRAGFGWSQPSPYPRTSERMVKELHTLLANAGVTGPYVLVGHSYGGIIVRAFARQYPGEVAGIVLVDSAHEEQAARVPAFSTVAAQAVGQFRTLSVMSSFGLLALSPENIPNRGLPEDALAEYRAILATTAYFEAAAAETEAFYSETHIAKIAGLGDLPLIVLSRGQAEPLPGISDAENQQYEEAWRIMQSELMGLSSNSQQIIAEQSGHYIQLQQPELVADAIQGVAQAALR